MFRLLLRILVICLIVYLIYEFTLAQYNHIKAFYVWMLPEGRL